jgi:hypothetical protein
MFRKSFTGSNMFCHYPCYTPLAVVSRTCKTLHVSTTATDRANSDVSSKEGAVIAAVLRTRKFHRSPH